MMNKNTHNKDVLVVDDNSAGSELQNPTSITLNVCWEHDRDEYDDGSDDYDGDDNDGDRWSKKYHHYHHNHHNR